MYAYKERKTKFYAKMIKKIYEKSIRERKVGGKSDRCLIYVDF